MGDGTHFTASAALAKDNTMPLFIPLYNAQGFAGGTVTFENIADTSDFDAWLRSLHPGVALLFSQAVGELVLASWDECVASEARRYTPRRSRGLVPSPRVTLTEEAS